MAHLTKPRACALGGIILIAALTILLSTRSADSATSAPVANSSTPSGSSTAPARPEIDAVEAVQDSNDIVLDWSNSVVRMNEQSVTNSVVAPPPAPPLALSAVTDQGIDSGPTTPAPVVTPVPTAEPVVTPVPTALPVVTPVPTALPVVTPVPTALPVVTPVPTPAPAVTPVPTAVPVVTPTPTPTPVNPGLSYEQRRGELALGRIGYDAGSVGYTISFEPENSKYLGLTFTRTRHIEIYVRVSMSDAQLSYAIAHELGHAVDVIRNTAEDRAAWRSARGMDPTLKWWPDHVNSDLTTPAGDFAECFAWWASGSASHSAWGSCANVSTLIGQLATS